MPDTKLSALPTNPSATSTDLLYIVDATPTSHGITVANHFRSLPVGAVGAPGLALYGDTDTGLYQVAANELGIAAGAVCSLAVGGTNTRVGHSAGLNLTVGTNNTLLGRGAGDLLTTGTYNICLGDGADPPANNSTYRLNIGGTIYGDLAAAQHTVGVNRVVAAAQLDVYQDQAAGARPVLKLEQLDVSEDFIHFVGTSANGVLTQSIVEEADVSAAVREGWLKIYIHDDGGQLVNQAYFVPVYTIT